MYPKVSSILPVWNGEKYLAEAIDSILSQNYPNFELIVINDGSTDQTETILNRYKGQCLRIDCPNRGLGASRNTGILVSSGEYLAFLDHDDLWEKTKLSRQMEALLSYGSKDPLLFSHGKQFLCPTLTEEEQKQIHVDTKEQPMYFAGTLILSRKRFDQIGPFVEEKILGEFVDWYLRALEKKMPVEVLLEITLRRRVHLQNMGRQKEGYDRNSYLRILKASLERRREG